MKKIEFEKVVLVRFPICLACNIEDWVIPRYRVFQFIMSRGMLNKECRMLLLSEENFFRKFVLRFEDDAEELLLTHGGRSLGSSLKEEF